MTINCPACGTADAYNGLAGWSCLNQKCHYYKPGISGSNKQPSTIPAPPVLTPTIQRALSSRGMIASPPKISMRKGPSTNTVAQQQDIAKEILNLLGAAGMVIICAGGAPRNWFENKLANDIDFFLWEEDYRFIDDGSFAKILNVPGFNDLNPKAYGYPGVGIIAHAFETHYKGENVQFVFANDWNGHFKSLTTWIEESFDFNICKCYFDCRINLSGVAYDDFQNKKLTCSYEKLQKYGRLPTLPKRSKKLQSYYPKHQIVIDP